MTVKDVPPVIKCQWTCFPPVVLQVALAIAPNPSGKAASIFCLFPT